MPIQSVTTGPQQVALALGVPKQIVPAAPNRGGLIITNSTSVAVLLSIGPVDPGPGLYTYKLGPGEQWVLPMYGAYQEVRAYSAALIALGAGLCFTEFVVP